MSQVNDYTIPASPLTMAELATTLEAAFAALGSINRGSTAPLAPFEGMLWWDSSANPEILKRYTVTYGWVSIVSVNITTGAFDAIGFVPESLFDANTILAATSDNTPAAVTVAEQRILGRKTGGNIAALTAAEVNAILGGAVLPWALITDVKATGVNGGSALAGTYNQRTLNTLTGISGYGDWCSLASSMFSLATGTYFIEASAPAFSCYSHQLHLYNNSTSSFVLRGTGEYSASYAQTRSFLSGIFTVTDAGHAYRMLHHTSNAQATNGLGRAVDNGDELYTVVKITKHS